MAKRNQQGPFVPRGQGMPYAPAPGYYPPQYTTPGWNGGPPPHFPVGPYVSVPPGQPIYRPPVQPSAPGNEIAVPPSRRQRKKIVITDTEGKEVALPKSDESKKREEPVVVTPPVVEAKVEEVPLFGKVKRSTVTITDTPDSPVVPKKSDESPKPDSEPVENTTPVEPVSEKVEDIAKDAEPEKVNNTDSAVAEDKPEDATSDDAETADSDDSPKEEDNWETQDEKLIEEQVAVLQTENTTSGKRLYNTQFLMQFRDSNTEKPSDMEDLSFLVGRDNNNGKSSRGKKDKNNRGKRRKGGRQQLPPKPRPTQTFTPDEATIRQATSILNKLVPETMEKLTGQLMDLNLSIDLLKIVAEKIFEKALTEPKYCYMYAVLCDSLSRNGNTPEYRKQFREVILGFCENEFKTRGSKVYSEDPQIREEEDYKMRLRMRGNMEFVGELYKRKVLSERVVIAILRKLVETDPPDNTDMEAFCKLMTTAGPQFDTQKNAEAMQYIFGSKLPVLASHEDLTLRTRFMIRDLLDLRKDGWKLRRKREVATTLGQVHRDAVLDKQEKEKSRNTRSSGGRGSNRYSNRPPHRESSSPSVSESKKSSGGDSEWTTTRGKGKVKKWGAEKQSISTTQNAFGKLAVNNNFGRNSAPQSPSVEEDSTEDSIQDEDTIKEEDTPEDGKPDNVKAENQTQNTLEEYFGGDDLEEAIACVKEILSSESTDTQQQEFIGYVFSHCFKKNVRDLKPLPRLFDGLIKENVLTANNLASGLAIVVRDLDDVAEECPNAPVRMGQVIGWLYNHFEDLKFLLDEEENIDSFNFSKLASSLIDVLEESDPNFDFTKAGLAGHMIAHHVATLKKKLKPATVEECCVWAEDINEESRADPSFAQAITSNLAREFSRSWYSESISEEQLEAEKALFEKYTPLLTLFGTSEEAKGAISKWVERIRDPIKTRAREYLASFLV